MPPPCTACGDQKSSHRNLLLTCIQCERPWHHRCHRPVVSDAELVQIIRRYKEEQNTSSRLQWRCVTCTGKKVPASTGHSKSAPRKPNNRSDVAQLPSASTSASISASTGPSRTTKSTQAPKKREPSPIVIDDDSEDEIRSVSPQPTHLRPVQQEVGRSTAAKLATAVSSTSSRGTPTLSATSGSAYSSRATSTSTEETSIITTRHPYAAVKSTSTQRLFHPLSQIPSRSTDVRIYDDPVPQIPLHNKPTSESRPQTLQVPRLQSTVSRDLIPDFREIAISQGKKPTLANDSKEDVKVSVGSTISAESTNQPALLPAWINARRASENVPDIWDRVTARRNGVSDRRRRKEFAVIHIPSAEQVIDPKGKGKARALIPADDPASRHTDSSPPFYFSADVWLREKRRERYDHNSD